MDIRKILYFSVSGFISFLAVTTFVCRVLSGGMFISSMTYYSGVPFIFLFTPGIGLVWFVGQSLEVDRKWRILIRSCMGLSGLLWLYVVILFFFGSTIELYQSR